MGTIPLKTTHIPTYTLFKMKKTLLVLAFVLGAALAEEDTEIEETPEGRKFLGPILGLLPPLATIVNIGSQVVILIALIGFVTGLKDVVNFDKIFGKSEDAYLADTGYYRREAYGPSVYTGDNYATNSAVAYGHQDPQVHSLAAKVNKAVEKQF